MELILLSKTYDLLLYPKILYYGQPVDVVKIYNIPDPEIDVEQYINFWLCEIIMTKIEKEENKDKNSKIKENKQKSNTSNIFENKDLNISRELKENKKS